MPEVIVQWQGASAFYEKEYQQYKNDDGKGQFGAWCEDAILIGHDDNSGQENGYLQQYGPTGEQANNDEEAAQ